jgi:hypothetical protein
MEQHETSGLREFYEHGLAAGFDFWSPRWMTPEEKHKVKR